MARQNNKWTYIVQAQDGELYTFMAYGTPRKTREALEDYIECGMPGSRIIKRDHYLSSVSISDIVNVCRNLLNSRDAELIGDILNEAGWDNELRGKEDL